MPSTPPEKSSRAGNSCAALVWALIIACCGLPLIWMLTALATSRDITGILYPLNFHARLLGRTLVYNAGVAVLATVLAWPVAVVVGRGSNRFAGVLGLVFPAALLMPSIVFSYGWMQVLRLANVKLHVPYPVPGTDADVLRCIWTLATWLWPIPAAAIGIALRRADPDLQQQALLDGAYWRVMLRQLLRPALGAFAVVAILAMQEFAVYEPTGVSVVATEVRTVFETGQLGLNNAAMSNVLSGQSFSLPRADQQRNAAAALVTAIPLLLSIFLLTTLALAGLRPDDDAETLHHGPPPRILRPSLKTAFFASIVIGITLIFPLLALLFSLRRSPDLGRVWRTFSPPVIGTLSVAAVTGALALVLAACGLVKRFTWPAALGLLTFLIGGQLLAIALIRLYNRPAFHLDRFVYNGPAIVVMAYLARFAWLAVWMSRPTWHGRWRALRDMAAVDGASPAATARLVVWPIAWPTVAACGLLVMLLSMTEVPATVLLSPMRPVMFTPQLMTWVHTLRSDDMIEGSLLLGAMVLVLAWVVMALARLARVRRAPLRVAAKRVGLLLLALLLVGCDGGTSPKEIWLESGAGEGQVVYPRAICYSKSDDTYFVADRLARIQHLDHNGKFIAGWRMPEFAQGKPVGLTVGPDGNLWVPDTHYSRVLVYTPGGKLLKQFGKFGKEKGEFIYPSDIAFDAKGHVFVSEFGDHDRIQVFDQNLNYLYEFGRFGYGEGEFSRPQSLLIVGDTLYLTDACNHRIGVYTTDGRFVRNMGRIGSALGELRFPYGLDIDAKGRLVVCEFGNNRVQLMDRETGRGIATWGSGGREPGQLAYPWGVAVDKNNRVVAVDAGNNRLQVFEF